MLSERVRLALAIFLLLGLGAGLAWVIPRAGQPDAPSLTQGLWLVRRIDLILQAVLVFVGGLGIRALLPLDEE